MAFVLIICGACVHTFALCVCIFVLTQLTRRILRTTPADRSDEDVSFLVIMLEQTSFVSKMFIDVQAQPDVFARLCRHMILFDAPMGTFVCREGQTADSAFIVLDGSVEVRKGGAPMCTFQEGEVRPLPM